MSLTSMERSVEKCFTEVDDVDDPLSHTLSLISDSAYEVDRNGSNIDAEQVIKITDGLKSSSTIVKFDGYYSSVVQEGFEPNVFDPKRDATHNNHETKEDVRMQDKTTKDVDDIWDESHEV